MKYEPLAISFTNDEISTGKYEKTSVCRALKLAANGDSFVIDEAVSTCPGEVDIVDLQKLPLDNRKGDYKDFLLRARNSPVQLFHLRECRN